MKEKDKEEQNIRLKRQLIVQSFTPLFALVLIKYFDWNIIPVTIKFFQKLLHGDVSVFVRIWKSPVFGSFFVSLISLIWIIIGLIALWQLKDAQSSNYKDNGQKVVIEEELTESGITFFMTFVLPLLLDDVTTLRGLLLFWGILSLVFLLMWRTNLYYQNPILTILGYKVYKIHFVAKPNKKSKTYIAVCRKELDPDKIVKWKHISDDVLLMYNKNDKIEHKN